MAASDALPPAVWPPTPPAADGRFGDATLSPDGPVVAGSTGTWTVTYTAGLYGIDDGGALRLVFHTISDWGAPQFADPAAPDYCTVTWTTPAPCHLEVRYDAELGVRPWKRVVQLRVRDAAVRPGDAIAITLGDRSGGSPGARAQTFAGPMRFQVLLDAFGTGVFVPTGPPLALPLVAGPPDHLRVHAPSDAVAGEPFELTVAIRDRWGNLVSSRRQPARLDQPGVHTIPVDDGETGLRGESNPIRCHPAGRTPPQDRIFWGDLHAQTEETIGAGTLEQHFAYARDCAALDFVGHQGNDFQVTRELWQNVVRTAARYHQPGRFVTFPGYEWSGNTPGGGDHNVHFLNDDAWGDDLHRSSHWQVPDRADEASDRYPVTRLYETFRGRADVVLIPHVGGRYANLQAYFDEAVMPLVEVASCWGVFEWFFEDVLRRGLVCGFCAGSDDHTARPGMSAAPRAHFGTAGGLTAALARERTREAIWEAFRARRTYATTGARLLLDVVANGRHPMGAAFDSHGEVVEIAVRVHGTAPLWRVELLRWPDVVYRHPFPPPALPAGRHRLRLGWTGARIRARHRLARWDGSLTLGSESDSPASGALAAAEHRGAMTNQGSTSGAADAAGVCGLLLSAHGWGFDHPEHGITSWTEREVAWRSETAGDWDGIVVELEGPDDAPLRFASGPASFTVTPRDVAERRLVVDAGGVGQRVEVERDPGPDQPRAVAFVYRDERPLPGRHPYFVRVTQQDGHVAWSSPIFVATRSLP